MAEIVADKAVRTSFDRQMDKSLVVWVFEHGQPETGKIALFCERTERIQQAVDEIGAQV